MTYHHWFVRWMDLSSFQSAKVDTSEKEVLSDWLSVFHTAETMGGLSLEEFVQEVYGVVVKVTGVGDL